MISNPFAYLSVPHKLHLMAHCLLIAWQSIASAVPPPAVSKVYGDGQVYRNGVLEPGFPFVHAGRTWQQFAEERRGDPAIWLHCPMGNLNLGNANLKMMQVDQYQELEKLTATDPDNTDLAARADGKAFVKAWANRPAKQRFDIYVGGPVTVDQLPGDTPQLVAQRIYDQLWWVREACPDGIGLDATKGDNPKDTAWSKIIWGPRGAESLLIKMLKRDGFDIWLEPSPFANAPRLHECWTVFEDSWLPFGQQKQWYSPFHQQTFMDPHTLPRCARILKLQTPPSVEVLNAKVAQCKAAGEVVLLHYHDWPKGWTPQ